MHLVYPHGARSSKLGVLRPFTSASMGRAQTTEDIQAYTYSLIDLELEYWNVDDIQMTL